MGYKGPSIQDIPSNGGPTDADIEALGNGCFNSIIGGALGFGIGLVFMGVLKAIGLGLLGMILVPWIMSGCPTPFKRIE